MSKILLLKNLSKFPRLGAARVAVGAVLGNTADGIGSNPSPAPKIFVRGDFYAESYKCATTWTQGYNNATAALLAVPGGNSNGLVLPHTLPQDGNLLYANVPVAPHTTTLTLAFRGLGGWILLGVSSQVSAPHFVCYSVWQKLTGHDAAGTYTAIDENTPNFAHASVTLPATMTITV